MRYGLTFMTLSALAVGGGLTASTVRSCETLPCPEFTYPEDYRSGCWPHPLPFEEPENRIEGAAPSFAPLLVQALPYPPILPPLAPQGTVAAPQLPTPGLTPSLPNVPSAPQLQPQQQIVAPAPAA